MLENIIGFLDLFESTMGKNIHLDENEKEKAENTEIFNVALLDWLENYFPPAVFEQVIVDGEGLSDFC